MDNDTSQNMNNQNSAFDNREALRLAISPEFTALVARPKKSNHATVHPTDLWSIAEALHDLSLFVTSSVHLGFGVMKDTLTNGSIRPQQQNIDECRLLLAERCSFVLLVKQSQSERAILRDERTYQLVGVAFVIDRMDGQKWEDEEQNRREYVLI